MNKRLCSPAHCSIDGHHPKADPLFSDWKSSMLLMKEGKCLTLWSWRGLYLELDRFVCLLLRSNNPALRWVLKFLWRSWSHNVPGGEIMPISWTTLRLIPFFFTCTLACISPPSRIVDISRAIGCSVGHWDKCCFVASQQVKRAESQPSVIASNLLLYQNAPFVNCTKSASC